MRPRRGLSSAAAKQFDKESTETILMQLTIEEIESACDASQDLDFSTHQLDGPELLLSAVFYPSGFPVEVRTNSAEILSFCGEMWNVFAKRFDTELVRIDVHVVESDSTECPSAVKYQKLERTMVFAADAENFGVVHFGRNESQVRITQAAMRHKLYVQQCFLAVASGPHWATRYMTPVHAACVALDGHGIMLCGDSGAGKSTLSYACARAGWTYVSDDASFLLNCGTGRTVSGDCHRVRFRPTAAELFPELIGLELTPRMTGKPSIEMPTAAFPQMVCAQTVNVDFMVFLNRRTEGPPELRPYRKDVARYFMQQTLYGTPETLAVQYKTIERLLTAEVFELRYRDLGWAIERLEKLAREGG
jgi:hypothetical protein